jgi:hypothetical protein
MNVTKVIQNAKGEMKIEFSIGWDSATYKTPEGLSNEIVLAIRALVSHVNRIAELRIPLEDQYEIIQIDGVELKEDTKDDQGLWAVIFFSRKLLDRPGLTLISKTPKLFQNAKFPELRATPGLIPEVENIISKAEQYFDNNLDIPLFQGIDVPKVIKNGKSK